MAGSPQDKRITKNDHVKVKALRATITGPFGLSCPLEQRHALPLRRLRGLRFYLYLRRLLYLDADGNPPPLCLGLSPPLFLPLPLGHHEAAEAILSSPASPDPDGAVSPSHPVARTAAAGQERAWASRVVSSAATTRQECTETRDTKRLLRLNNSSP